MKIPEDLKKHMERKTAQSLMVISTILWDIVIIGTMFLGVWIIDFLARIFGLESSYFVQILHEVSEIGFIILYLILAVWGLIITYKLFKEENKSTNYKQS